MCLSFNLNTSIMELGWVLDKVRMPKTMPGQNDWIVSALLGSLVQIQGAVCGWLGFSKAALGPSAARVRVVSCFAQHCWFKNYPNLWEPYMELWKRCIEICRWFFIVNSILQPFCIALGSMTVPLCHISVLEAQGPRSLCL